MTVTTIRQALDEHDEKTWTLLSSEHRRLFDLWRESPNFDHRIFPLIRKLVIYGEPTGRSMPSLHHGGDESLAAKTLGLGWREELKHITGNNLITSGYERAYVGEPVYEYVFYEAGASMAYERLILRFIDKRGFTYLVNLSTLIKLDLDNHLPNRENVAGAAHQNSMVLLGLDSPSSLNNFVSG